MFAHAHQVSMDHAANFETTAFQPHGILINSINLYKFIFLFANFLVKMVVHVFQQQLVTSVNVHIPPLVQTVKLSFNHVQFALALSAHAQHRLSLLSIHAFQIHVKTMVDVLSFSMLLDVIAQTASVVTIVNSVCFEFPSLISRIQIFLSP